MTSLFWNRNRRRNDLFAFESAAFRKCQRPAPPLIQPTPLRILGIKDPPHRIALFVGLLLIGSGLPTAAAPDRPDRQPESAQGKQHVSALEAARPTIALRSGRFSPIGSPPRNLAALRAASNSQEPIHVLVQFDQIPDAASRRTLRAHGLDLLGYVPSNAFVSKVSSRTAPEDLARNHVKWIGGFYPEDKLPARITSSGIGAWAIRPDGSADLRVKYHKDVPIERAVRDLQTTGARIVASDRVLSEITVNVAPEIVDSLSRLDCVRWIEEVPPPPINWNDGTRPNVQADLVQAAPYDLSGAGVTVGIWDAGDVDASHGDLAGRVTLAESTGTPNPHSTHVAGILAGDGTLSVAAGGQDRQWRGIATSAKIVSFNNADPIPKHQLAIDQYDVILSQNSWGVRLIEFLGNCGLYGTYSSLSPEFDQLVTGLYGRRLNVIFAAGNLRNGLDINSCGVGPYGTIGPPSTAKDILCVGAIASDDNSMPVFSSWGPTEDGRLKPDLVAPGTQVTGDHGITSTSPGGTYAVLQGTSMSAPVISGATALLVENHRSLYSGQNPLPSTIKGLLIHAAADLDDGAPWYQRGPDYASGYGRVQIKDAVDQLRGGGFLIGEVDHGAVSSYRLKVPEGAGEIRLTLVWDDPAGLENAATALVNDLDLVVFDPDGVRHYPWTLDPLHPDAPAVRTAEDHLNVIEQVVVDPPVGAGDWTVQVVGHNVPVDAPQKFTLLFSPMSIPAPSILELDQATSSEDPNGAANGNGYIDPGETILANVVLRNTDGPTASNVTATISTDAGGITLLQAESPYPDLRPGGTGTNIVPFSFRVSKTFPCGTAIPFQHVVSYGEFQVTNFFTAVVGFLTVTNQSTNRFVNVDVPKDIPDDGLVISTNSVATSGLVRDLDVSVRIDHTWYGDLQLELENPDGTRVRLVSATGNYGQNLGQGDCQQPELHTTFDDAAAEPFSDGVAPFVGSFRPEEALAGFDNKPLEGDWQLWVADQAINDTGTLLCWSMNVAYDQQGYVCTLFNRTPVVSGLDVNVYRDTPKVIAFTAVDPDEDPLEFQLTAPPANGTLSLFETNTGHCIYSPSPGYSGLDSFSVQISDGYTNVTATVTITVLPPLTDLAVNETLAPNPVGVNQSVTISLVVTNQGPNGATGLMLTNLLPEGLIFESAVASQGSCNNSGNIVVCDLGVLAIAAGAQVTILAQAIETGPMTNAVSVNAVEDEVDPANNSATAVLDARLTTDLTVISQAVPETVLYGQAADFQTMVTNSGPSVATQLRITDILPPGFDLLGIEVDQGSWTNNGGLVIWQPGDLAPGESVTAHVHARGGLLGGATNVVTVSEDEVDLNPGDNRAETPVVVVPSADLAVGMQAFPAVTAIGQELRYDIGVTNNGPNIAHGVTLEDLL
ncbi:MAG TPA: S8 family serine peptidase, partial [Candidatus Nitrosotalea sp.]|nr:S8 family serine peptidase [Candidatus Nitrosotalea sp.]